MMHIKIWTSVDRPKETQYKDLWNVLCVCVRAWGGGGGGGGCSLEVSV